MAIAQGDHVEMKPALSLYRRVLAPAQLRAARSLLDWTRHDLAQIAGLSPETIKNIEHGTFTPTEATVQKIFETFAKHGVDFISTNSTNAYGVILIAIPPQEAPVVEARSC